MKKTEEHVELLTKWHHVLGYGSAAPDVLVWRAPPIAEIAPIRGAVAQRSFWYERDFEKIELRDLRYEMWLPVDGAGLAHLDRFGDGTGLVGSWSFSADVEEYIIRAKPEVDRTVLRRHGIGRKEVAGPRNVPKVTFLNPWALIEVDASGVRSHDLSRLLHHVLRGLESGTISILVDDTDGVRKSPLWKIFQNRIKGFGDGTCFDPHVLLHAIAQNPLQEEMQFRSQHQEAKYAGRDLSHLDLGRADLRGADLKGCSFVGTDLTNANISGADLTDAILTDAAMTGIIADEHTRLPAKFTGEQAWELLANPLHPDMEKVAVHQTRVQFINSPHFPV